MLFSRPWFSKFGPWSISIIWTLLEMQVFTAHSRPTKSECLKLGHRNMGFKNLPFRWLWCTSRLENYSSGIKENLLNGILQQCSRLCFPIPFHGMNCLKVCPRLNSLWYQDSENQNNCHSVRPSDRSELHSKGSLSAASIELKKYLFIYLFLAALDLSCCSGFLLVAESGGSVCGGYSLVVLLIAVASRWRVQGQ